MRSVRTKFIVLTLTAVLVSAFLIGGICIQNIRIQGEQNAEKEMTLLRDNMQLQLDQYLGNIEQSVDMIHQFAVDEMDVQELMNTGVIGARGIGDSGKYRAAWNSPRQQALDEYLIQYDSKVEEVFTSLANHTGSVIAYYYRINQQLTRNLPSQGFLYSKVEKDSFEKVQVTDLSLYDPSDIDHVGWYYEPLRQGKPVWMKPYYNRNLGIHMFSYVIPVYKANTFLGVVGMDISYETLVEHLQQLQVLETGYACLVDEDGYVIYHPTLPEGTNVSDLVSTLGELPETRFAEKSSDGLIAYELDGIQRKLTYTTLKSGVKLILVAPEQEINARWEHMAQRVATASASILAVFILLALLVTRQITQPLQRLTVAAERIAAGDYDIELDYHGNDEVGTLTDTFRQLTAHLKGYIGDLNSKAFSDSLTGVKNKSAFADCAKALDEMIATGDKVSHPVFALAMLDCNDLKKVNDQYGHDKGISTCVPPAI